MLILLAIVFGLIVGSFLNVVINRLRLGKSLNGRSECPHCQHTLQPLDLVPVFSFIFLEGRCRFCGKKISIQYLLVEAVTSLSFLLFALKLHEFSADLLFFWVLAAFFIVIAVYDLKHFIILDKVVFPGLAVAIIFAAYRDVAQACFGGLGCATISGLLGAALISGFFYLQYAVSGGRWIGFGDVKFGLMLGMAAGFPISIFLLFLAYVIGAVTGLSLIAANRKTLASKMPFGTFLALSAIIALLYGQQISDWYLRLIGFY